MARRATHAVTNPHHDTGVATLEDLLGWRLVHGSGDECVHEGLRVEGGQVVGALPETDQLDRDAEPLIEAIRGIHQRVRGRTRVAVCTPPATRTC